MHAREGQLSTLSHVGDTTERMHADAVLGFVAWLQDNSCSVKLELLVSAPALLDSLLVAYCNELYTSNAPLYMYLMILTALQRFRPALKHRLPSAWVMATNWRLAEPVCHRTPLPLALFKALVVLAVLRGLPRFAGCVVIAFCGPTRVTETLTCLRRNLLMPCDMLGAVTDRIYVHFNAPKSRNRGGPRHQHATIRGPEVRFLVAVFEHLGLDDSLYGLSAATFRKRWDGLMGLLCIPPRLYTPGSMRGGGAVAAYMQDTSIPELLWRMRIQNIKTLEHYLQEVTAATSLASLSETSRKYIEQLSGLYETVLASNPQQPLRAP